MPLGGVKSCLVKVCFEVPSERLECTRWTEWVRKRVQNTWSSCTQWSGTKNKVSVGNL